MTFDQKIAQKANAIGEWLEKHHPYVIKEQRHIVEGTPERVYWHYGYLVALRDVQDLMDAELDNLTAPTIKKV